MKKIEYLLDYLSSDELIHLQKLISELLNKVNKVKVNDDEDIGTYREILKIIAIGDIIGAQSRLRNMDLSDIKKEILNEFINAHINHDTKKINKFISELSSKDRKIFDN